MLESGSRRCLTRLGGARMEGVRFGGIGQWRQCSRWKIIVRMLLLSTEFGIGG